MFGLLTLISLSSAVTFFKTLGSYGVFFKKVKYKTVKGINNDLTMLGISRKVSDTDKRFVYLSYSILQKLINFEPSYLNTSLVKASYQHTTYYQFFPLKFNPKLSFYLSSQLDTKQ